MRFPTFQDVTTKINDGWYVDKDGKYCYVILGSANIARQFRLSQTNYFTDKTWNNNIIAILWHKTC